MKRKIYNKLLLWKNNMELPLMILGTRQCGKTYIIREFCMKEFKNFYEVNLLNDKQVINIYKSNMSSEKKYIYFKEYLKAKSDIENEDTIIFIDEIQECEELISELKYFAENKSKLNIVCAGSLLGVKLCSMKLPFPVGKVKTLRMFPMDFEEFLMATNNETLRDDIKNCYTNNEPLIDFLHQKALELYRSYLVIGGMPKSIQNYIDVNEDLSKIDKDILKNINDDYLDDMQRHISSPNESLKLIKTYNSIPMQMKNDSKKFMYSKIEKGGRKKEFELSIDWLLNSNLVYKSLAVKSVEKPLKVNAQDEFFKLYMCDIGLLINKIELDSLDVLLDDIGIYKGIIAENYVCEQIALAEKSIYYYRNENYCEVDFLLEKTDGIIPVEVKASDNVNSKSLTAYIKKYNPPYALRLSQKNFGYNEESKIKSVPLYAAFCIY